MVSIFDYFEYREFLSSWIKGHGSKSHGLKSKMASHMGISSTLMSLILKGEKSLMPEQALPLSEHIGLNELETDYFLLLIDKDRAGSQHLKNRIQKNLNKILAQAKQVSSRVKKDAELSEEKKAVFYSSWIFSAIRNLTAIEGFNNTHAIAEKLNLPIKLVTDCLEFLVENGLCVKNKEGFSYGPAVTFIPRNSHFVNQHHRNWREKSMQLMDLRSSNDLFITTPMTLSESDAQKIKSILLTAYENSMKIVKPSPSEKTYCLNIDWFEW